jgi:glucokinase
LIAAARAGDVFALEKLQRPSAALGAAIAGAVALLGSRRVIVSGGLAESLDVLAPLILAVVKRHLPPHLRVLTLTAAHFSTRASLVGAGIAANGNPLWVAPSPIVTRSAPSSASNLPTKGSQL